MLEKSKALIIVLSSIAIGRLHQQDLAHPHAGISPDELGSRHEAECGALQDQHMREKQLLNNWNSVWPVGGFCSGRPNR